MTIQEKNIRKKNKHIPAASRKATTSKFLMGFGHNWLVQYIVSQYDFLCEYRGSSFSPTAKNLCATKYYNNRLSWTIRHF